MLVLFRFSFQVFMPVLGSQEQRYLDASSYSDAQILGDIYTLVVLEDLCDFRYLFWY